jgi:RHS repeat-associated protein
MSNPRQTLLCRYLYDPLDRLVDCAPNAEPINQRFYLKERLSTEIQGTQKHSVMQHENQLLAQQQRHNSTLQTQLLATDQQRSVVALLDATRADQLAYSPYGHRQPENGLLSLLGFNGERPDPVTGCYLLGNGYRAFSPVLMRFYCADSWSPFGRGGINAYGYCLGDPVNSADPTGHANVFMKLLKLTWKKKWLKTPTKQARNPLAGTYRKTESTNKIIGDRTPAISTQLTDTKPIKILEIDLKTVIGQKTWTIKVLSGTYKKSTVAHERLALSSIINEHQSTLDFYTRELAEFKNWNASPATTSANIRDGLLPKKIKKDDIQSPSSFIAPLTPH